MEQTYRPEHSPDVSPAISWRSMVIGWIAFFVMLSYVTSYFVISRRAFAAAQSVGCPGYYFYMPENSDTWRRKEQALRRFYWPLIRLEYLLGTDVVPAGEPLWSLSFESRIRTVRSNA